MSGRARGRLARFSNLLSVNLANLRRSWAPGREPRATRRPGVRGQRPQVAVKYRDYLIGDRVHPPSTITRGYCLYSAFVTP